MVHLYKTSYDFSVSKHLNVTPMDKDNWKKHFTVALMKKRDTGIKFV